MHPAVEEYVRTLCYKNLQTEPAPKPTPPVNEAKTLDAQIVELMATLPPQLRDRPWSMAELVQRLSGKYRARPHGQQVGQALLRLGWRKERRWERGYDGARVWLQP